MESVIRRTRSSDTMIKLKLDVDDDDDHDEDCVGKIRRVDVSLRPVIYFPLMEDIPHERERSLISKRLYSHI